MSAGIHIFEIEAGTDWERNIFLKDNAGSPINITGYTATMTIKAALDGAKVHELISTGGTPEIAIDGANGKITLTLTDVQTLALNVRQGVYDLLLCDAGDTEDISKLLKGTITVDPVVTR